MCVCVCERERERERDEETVIQKLMLAQSVGLVEYTDYFSAEK